MFRKSIKIKSNNQLKSSERKNVKDMLIKSFPKLVDNEIDHILGKKDVINCIKLQTGDETILVYSVQKNPMIFIYKDHMYPTINLLWKYPNLLDNFTVHSQVFEYIKSGADLMVPGVVTPPGPQKYGNINAGIPAYVNTTDNKAAIAVGITAQSSFEMARGKGKCMAILHYYGDKLCTLESSQCPNIEDLGPPDWCKFQDTSQQFPTLNDTFVEIDKEMNDLTITTDPIEEMDELLNYCFMTAIKYSKTINLPILTSNFYKLQMIPICPVDKVLDIKKTSYKKLKTFLDKQCKDGLIVVKEMKKGVESLVEINKNHPKFCEFYVNQENRPKIDRQTDIETSIVEYYVVTSTVLPIFALASKKKGDAVYEKDIRMIVTNYVKSKGLQCETNNKLVRMDDLLQTICKTVHSITWEELFEHVIKVMKPYSKVTTGLQETLNKGKLPPIILSISMRSGNKKVTLIDNLELYNISVDVFAKECQHGIAASTSISKPPGKKCQQLLVQGNQINFIHNLLTDKYKISKRFIRGLENAPKKK